MFDTCQPINRKRRHGTPSYRELSHGSPRVGITRKPIGNHGAERSPGQENRDIRDLELLKSVDTGLPEDRQKIKSHADVREPEFLWTGAVSVVAWTSIVSTSTP